jgi:hypothetical protein
MKEIKVMFSSVKAHHGTLFWMIALYECQYEKGRV